MLAAHADAKPLFGFFVFFQTPSSQVNELNSSLNLSFGSEAELKTVIQNFGERVLYPKAWTQKLTILGWFTTTSWLMHEYLPGKNEVPTNRKHIVNYEGRLHFFKIWRTLPTNRWDYMEHFLTHPPESFHIFLIHREVTVTEWNTRPTEHCHIFWQSAMSENGREKLRIIRVILSHYSD